MHALDFLPAVGFRPLERKFGNADRTWPGDDLQALGHFIRHHMLDCRIGVFRVFPEAQNVDLVPGSLQDGNQFGRTNVGIKVEHFPECHVGTLVSGSDRGGRGPLDRNLVLRNGLDGFFGEKRSVLFQTIEADVFILPGNVHAAVVNNRPDSFANLRPGSFPGKHRNNVFSHE